MIDLTHAAALIAGRKGHNKMKSKLKETLEAATAALEGQEVPTPADVQKSYLINLKNLKDKKAAMKATAQEIGLKDIVVSSGNKIKKYRTKAGQWVSATKSMIQKKKK